MKFFSIPPRPIFPKFLNNLKLLTLLFVFQVGYGSSASAADLEEFKVFPLDLKVGEMNLHRQGAGHRTASFFNIKVYIAALYLEKKYEEGKAKEDLTTSKETKSIELHPLYDISKEDSQKGWNLALQDACAKQCQEIQKEQAAFLKIVPAFKKGEHHRYLFSGDQFEFFLNEKSIFKSKDKSFAQVLLKTWVGEKPVSESLKKDLLGEDSKLE